MAEQHQAEQAEKRRRANEAKSAGGKKAGRGRPIGPASREATPGPDPARPDKTATAIAREAGCSRATVEREILDAAHLEPLSVDWAEAMRRARERTDADGQ